MAQAGSIAHLSSQSNSADAIRVLGLALLVPLLLLTCPRTAVSGALCRRLQSTTTLLRRRPLDLVSLPSTSLPARQQPLPGPPRLACRLARRQLDRKPPPRPMSGLTFSCPLGTDRRRHLRRRHYRLLPSSTRVGVTQLAVGHPSGRQLVFLTQLVFSTMEWVASSVQQ